MKILINNKNFEIKDKKKIPTGNVNTYILDVEYDNAYKERQIIIYFKNNDIKKIVPVGPDNTVKIPHEVLKKAGILYIGFYSSNSNGEILIDRYSSNLDTLEVTDGAYDEDAEYTEDISSSILEQYLQEMREFYNESLEEYNSNADEKIKEYNDNASQKITDYNTNAKSKTDDFNSNYESKKKEIDKVSKDKEEITEIEKRVIESEENAKISETNASISESNAQNSVENALEILTNVTSIQDNINASKTHIDEQKIKVDKSVENVEKLVEEATNQANISKEQADLATEKANQTSTDKSAVETIKSEVSTMKSSVEQTKTATEQIKTDTQTIKEDTTALKDETLQAKIEVESSLQNERNESDKKYARAIETDEIVIDGFGQVDLDEDGFMKEFSAEGNLPEITQKIRQGYNKVKGFISEGIYNGSVENGVFTSVSLNGYGNARTRFESLILEANKTYYASVDCRALNNSYNNAINILLYYLTGENEYGIKRGTVVQNPNIANEYQRTIVQFDIEEEMEVGGFLIQTNNATDAVIELANPMISEQNIDYEPYGVSPSMDYSSEFENIVKNISVDNNQGNILNSDKLYIFNSSKYIGTKPAYNEAPAFSVEPNTEYAIISNMDFRDARFLGWKNSVNNGRLATTKDSQYTKFVRYFNTGDNNQLSFFVGAFLTDTQGVYQTFNDSDDFFEKTEFMIIKSSYIKDGVLPEYKKYNGYNENLALSEGQFLGIFKGFENYIEKDKLKRRLKILTLDGTINKLLGKHPSIKNDSRGFYIFNLPNRLHSSNGDNLNAMCTHLIFTSSPNAAYLVENNEDGIWWEGRTEFCYISLPFTALQDANNLLKEQYEAGTPVQILYVTNEEEQEDLSIENKSKINSLKIYKGINNIYSNCKLGFKTNKNTGKAIEEINEKINQKAGNSAYGTVKGANMCNFLNGSPYAATLTLEQYNSVGNTNFIGKGTLENVLNGERESNNIKYPKVLKDVVKDEKSVQIYAENPEVKNLVIKGNEITQKTRNGYNKYDKDTEVMGMISASTGVLNPVVNAWRSSEYISIKELTEYLFSWRSSHSFFQVIFAYYNSNKEFVSGDSIAKHNMYKTNITTPENASFLRISYSVIVGDINVSRDEIQLIEGTEEKPYEEYGASPSLDYSSEIKVTTEQNINVTKGNMLDITLEDVTKSGVKAINNGDDSVNIKGISTETSKNISFDLGTIELKKGESISVKLYGLEGLSTDIRFLTLVNAGVSTLIDFRNKDFATYTPTEDVTGTFRFYVKPGQAVDVTIKVMAVKGIKTVEEMPEFRKYQSKDYKVVLPEGKFTGNFQGFKNYIKDNKLKGRLKILTLIGNENWKYEEAENRFSIYNLKLNVNHSNPEMCTHFKEQGTVSSTGRFLLTNDSLRFHNDKNMTSEEWKIFLAQQYEAGIPVQILYVTTEEFEEDLPGGTIPKIELMDDLNIVTIDNGTMSFEYNKSLSRAFEEEKENNAKLQAQIDEIKALLSTTNTASLLTENLAKDNESEVI